MAALFPRCRPGLLGLLAFVCVVAAAGPCPAQEDPEAPIPTSTPVSGRILDGIVAVIDGDPITLRELKRYGVTGAPFLAPEVRGDYRRLLESMIETRLLKAEFQRNGVIATDEMVQRYIAGVLEENGQTRAALEAEVARAGLNWDDYFERMREEVQRIQLVNLLIRSRVNVPEEEVRKVWEENPDYLEPQKLEVAAIFLPAPLTGEGADAAREKAAEVRRAANKDFEEAAREYSKGPGADDGGNLGEFARGTMASHFEKALAGLDEGDVSEPVEGPGGYYIVKLVDVHRPARRPFDEVKEELAEKLYEERLSQRYRKWATEDLRRDHRVDIMLDRLAQTAAGS